MNKSITHRELARDPQIRSAILVDDPGFAASRGPTAAQSRSTSPLLNGIIRAFTCLAGGYGV